MFILQILGIIFWMVLIPFGIGLLPAKFAPSKYRTPGFVYAMGFVLQLAVLEIVGIPIELIFVYKSYKVFCYAFGIISVILAILGIVLSRKTVFSFCAVKGKSAETVSESFWYNKKSIVLKIKEASVETKIYFIIAMLLIVFQLVMLFFVYSRDADDSFFNAQATSAQVFGTMYRIDAGTGYSTALDLRHCFALFPMYQAFVSTATGVHLLIIAHKVIPIVLIPLTYFLLHEFGKILFPKKPEAKWMFVLLMNVFKLFGMVSYYTAETFFLLRTWQGKSFAGNFLLPGIMLVFMLIHMSKRDGSQKFEILALGTMVLAAGSASSIAVLISVGLVCLLSVIFLFLDKDKKLFFKEVLSTIPGVIYMLLYLVMIVVY